MVWFLQLSLEQKSGFKLEINKDLTSIVIIIDMKNILIIILTKVFVLFFIKHWSPIVAW